MKKWFFLKKIMIFSNLELICKGTFSWIWEMVPVKHIVRKQIQYGPAWDHDQ
jgi:hypothetical protein